MTLRQRISRLAFAFVAMAIILATAAISPPAQAQNPKVAYIYKNDTAARDSFVSDLTLRGFDVTAVDLVTAGNDAGDPNFGQYAIIIIGHDTGGFPVAGWLGSSFAARRIIDSAAYIVGVGIGGGQFFSIYGLKIGLNNGEIGQSDGVTAVNPGDAAWNTPNPVTLMGDGSVRFFSGPVGGAFANPNPSDLTGVTPIAWTPSAKEGLRVFPIAAEVSGQFPNPCFLLWGHRAPPSFMNPAARDTFENLLRTNPCAQQSRAQANVSLTKAAPQSVELGVRSMRYTLTVENQGRIPAPGVFVEDQLPTGVTLLSVTPSQGMCRSGRRIFCELGDLGGGISATVQINVRPTETGELLNRAFAGGMFEDTNPSDNSASAVTNVTQAANFTPIRMLPYRFVPTEIFIPIPLRDLSVHGVEMTQGIQCFDTSQGLAGCADNSLPMVARKGTTARIYLRLSGGTSLNNVPVRLVLIDANNVEYVVNTVGKALPNIDRANASSSANVYFSVNFNNTTAVRFYAIVDPNNTIAETNEGNNRFPAAGTQQLNFTPSKTMKIIGQRLRYFPSGYTGSQYAGGWAVNGGAATWFEQLLPIRTGGISYNVASGYMNWTKTLPGSGNNQHDLIKELNSRWLKQNILSWLFGTGAYTGARHVYGWAPNQGYSGGHADMPIYPHAGGLGIVGIGTDAPGSSSDSPGAGALIFGHELIHDYDVKHTDTPDACGSDDDSSAWPYASSSIQEFGFNPITGKVYNPSNTQDVMSYCPAQGSSEGWLSPYTWNYMFNRLRFNARPEPAQTADTVLAISLSVTNPALGPEQGRFDSVAKVDATAPLVTPPAGEYALELRSAGGDVLSSTPFAASFESEYTQHEGDHPGDPTATEDAGVHMAIPWQEGTARLVILHNGVEIGSRDVSANPPSVLITNPTVSEAWQAGTTETITWEANDPDGDSLTYSVFYSRDGEEWELLATDLITPSLDIVVNDMAGSSEARFRVVANDGVYISSDETPLISVPNQQPIAGILNPTNNAALPFGNLLVLQGFGSDPEDGLLPDVSLVWSSDRAGELGSGAELPVEGLEKGLHQITLTVTDSLGETSSSTTTVFIGERLWLPFIVR